MLPDTWSMSSIFSAQARAGPSASSSSVPAWAVLPSTWLRACSPPAGTWSTRSRTSHPRLVATTRERFAQPHTLHCAGHQAAADGAILRSGQHHPLTNCIHATRDPTRSCTNIRGCLFPGGILCLVELTRGLLWFDLVFGFLEGWWLFEDGRRRSERSGANICCSPGIHSLFC
jgi:hypothetical protein